MSRYYLSLLLFFAVAALWAAYEPTAEELADNQRRVETLRKQPEVLAQLRENLQAFDALAKKRQDAILQLDHDLHELPAPKQTKLWNVLERYADWLDQLKKDDPQVWRAIKDASDPATRLSLIKAQRDREWMQGQPKAYREQWAKLPAGEQAKFVARLRAEVRQQHADWQLAQKFWTELEAKKELPCRLSDFSSAKDGSAGKVRVYVEEYLLPFLSAAEKEQLAKAEGRWPDYPRALVEVASKHPSALPPAKMPRSLAELPTPIQARVSEKKDKLGKKKGLLQQLHAFDGRDEFASKVVEFGTKKGTAPFEFEFWASSYKSLQGPMKKFVDEQLKPALDTQEKKALLDSENGWPFYPQTIQELSQKHKLHPPWHILPEAEKWKWDAYRLPKARASS